MQGLQLFLVVVCLALFTSCGSPKQVEGEVFIKTEAYNNVPLSLVEVSVFTRLSSVHAIDRAFYDWEKLHIHNFRERGQIGVRAYY